MSVLLFIDTSLSGCHVALYSMTSRQSFVRNELMQRGQSERLVPLIVEMLAEAECDFNDVKAVITTTGPGSFTGLRVGLSTVRTIAQTTKCISIGMTDFDVFRFGQPENTAVIIESRRDDFYVSVDGQDVLINPASFLEKFGTRELVLVGDGVDRLLSELGTNSPKTWLNTGISTLPLVDILIHYAAGGKLAEKPLTPYYLREPDVTTKQANA